MWVSYTFLSALTAASLAMFAKPGVKRMDTTAAPTLRFFLMAALLVTTGIRLGTFIDFS